METIENQILAVQKKIDACSEDPEERKLLMKEKALLMKKEELLMKKEELLMKKEEQLREEKLILLRHGVGNVHLFQPHPYFSL